MTDIEDLASRRVHLVGHDHYQLNEVGLLAQALLTALAENKLLHEEIEQWQRNYALNEEERSYLANTVIPKLKEELTR